MEKNCCSRFRRLVGGAQVSRKWRAPYWLGLVVACLVPLAAAAHQRMDMAAMQAAPLGASAAFDGHGRLWVVTTNDGHVWLRHSDDFGQTLSKPSIVNPKAETIYASGENRPAIAIGPDGQIDVAWTQKASAGWTGYLRFTRSTDGGRHFTAPVTVNHDPAKVTRGFDSLAVTANGDIVLLWIDARDAANARAAAEPYAGFAAYYSWSTDGGKTFAPERKLADHSCECCRTAMALTPSGQAAAFFRSVYDDNIRDHTFAVLQPTGQTTTPTRATFSGWQVAACPDQGPGLAISADGTRHAVWYEASHGPAIWYGQLDPGQRPRHVLKVGGRGASHADVAAHGQDVWVAWNQVDAAGFTLMLRTSRDGGSHFGPPRTIATSSVAVYSPQLLVHAGHAWVAWNTAGGFRLVRTTVPEATP